MNLWLLAVAFSPILYVTLVTYRMCRTRRSAKVAPRDGAAFISDVPHGKEREWLAWHWKLATTQFGTDYVFREMPLPPRHDDMEQQPRKVDPVPDYWRTGSGSRSMSLDRLKRELDIIRRQRIREQRERIRQEHEYHVIKLELPR